MVAPPCINGYNGVILRAYKTIVNSLYGVIGAVISTCLIAFTLAGNLSAQSLPQSSPNSLQSQTGQAQATGGAQNQVGTLQNNNGQNALGQASQRPLGVVSDPDQTTPEAVVTPSPTLTTDVAEDEGPDNALRNIIVVIALGFIIIFLYRRLIKEDEPVAQQDENQPASRPAPEFTQSVKKPKKPRKKRKKSNQR
jgi:hypothetical protein